MTVNRKHKVTVQTKSGAVFHALVQSDDEANKIADAIIAARPARGVVKMYEGAFAEGDHSFIDTDSIESITVRRVV